MGFVTDGSEWLQKFADQHRPDAVRILDFPHAGEHIAAVGQASLGEGSQAAQQWLKTQLHELKHSGPDALLAEVRRLSATHPESADIWRSWLTWRSGTHMRYPAFLAAGWPMGEAPSKVATNWSSRRAEGQRHALGAAACGSDVSTTQHRLQRAGMRRGPRSCARCASRRSSAEPSAVTNAIGLAAAQPVSQLRRYRALRRHNQPQFTPA